MDLRTARKQLMKSHYRYSGIFWNRRLTTVIHLYLTQSLSNCQRDNGVMNSIRQFNQKRLKVLSKLIDLHLDECVEYQGKSIKTINKCLNKYEKIAVGGDITDMDCKRGCPFCITTSVLYAIYCSICVNNWYQIKTEMNAWQSMDITTFTAFNSCPIHKQCTKNCIIIDDEKSIANFPLHIYKHDLCYTHLDRYVLPYHKSDNLQHEQYHIFSSMFGLLGRILMRQGKTYKHYYILTQIIDKLNNYVDKHTRDITRLLSIGLQELIPTQSMWSTLDMDPQLLTSVANQVDHICKKVVEYCKQHERPGRTKTMARIVNNRIKVNDIRFPDEDTLLIDVSSGDKSSLYFCVLDRTSIFGAKFDNKFEMIMDTIKYDKSLTSCVYDVYRTFFDYSLYLSNNKIKNGEKYFYQY